MFQVYSIKINTCIHYKVLTTRRLVTIHHHPVDPLHPLEKELTE